MGYSACGVYECTLDSIESELQLHICTITDAKQHKSPYSEATIVKHDNDNNIIPRIVSVVYRSLLAKRN